MYYPKISIVVLNWNGKDDTMECLESVRQMDYPNFNVIVVDNGSSDDSVKAIQERYPEVIVLETEKNLGFAGGNNVGISYALRNGAEYILLLNNDTVVDSQLLKNLIQAESIVQQEGIFSPKIYYYSNPQKIWYAGARWVNKVSGFDHIGQGCIDNGQDFSSIAETDYACGCALFINVDLLKRIGLFDEKFFLTFEETDLCYRARRMGVKTYFVPEAKVWHKVSASLGGEGSALFNYFLMRNRLLWAEKNLPFGKRLVLYRLVFYELSKYILPPRFRLNRSGNNSLFKGIYRSVADYKNSCIKKYKNPIRKARMWGVRDYFLRRFGNCPESVKSLEN
jgi:GT2 family glycosyltransferase